jgi:dUTP pyrophosphatase
MLIKNDIKILVRPANGAQIPVYQTAGSAGADICACLDTPVCIKPGDVAAVPTGLFFEIPAGYEVQIRPRSGLAINSGITCLNTPGTIDSDYRGEIKVILINHGKNDFIIHHGDRIAQMVASPVIQANFIQVDQLSVTKRSDGGFGSTGKA